MIWCKSESVDHIAAHARSRHHAALEKRHILLISPSCVTRWVRMSNVRRTPLQRGDRATSALERVGGPGRPFSLSGGVAPKRTIGNTPYVNPTT